mgnify:CR=1 FL=1
MSAKNNRSFVASFLKSSSTSVLLAGIAAGLYPILFYYSNNFQLVNTWQHFLFFVASFIGLPVLLFYIIKKLFVKVKVLQKWQQYVVPFLGVFTFLFLMKICLYAGIQKKMILGIVLILSGIVFKLSAAPFHMWTPDVYEGAPIASVTYFAVAQKIGMLIILINFVDGVVGKVLRLAETSSVVTIPHNNSMNVNCI